MENPSYTNPYFPYSEPFNAPVRVKQKYGLHLLLFIVTLATTTLAGAEMIYNKQLLLVWFDPKYSFSFQDYLRGLAYSLPFLLFLTCHEFGHYFMAVYHRVKCTLPFYIPIYIPAMPLNIGTFGAVIRLKETPDSNIKYFDIGIAGPLAGFVVSVVLLIVGFLTLPPLEYLYDMNPEYQKLGYIPTEAQIERDLNPLFKVGNSLIFWLGETLLADPNRMPNHYELIHYPLLFVGYITLFFTALNLLPIGQFDGGHIVYGLFGYKRAAQVSRLAVLGLILYGGLGLVNFNENWSLALAVYLIYLFYLVPRLLGKVEPLYIALTILGILVIQQTLQHLFTITQFNMIWLVYGFLSTRVMGAIHPPAYYERKLDLKRKILGWAAMVIFALCFTPSPLVVFTPAPTEKQNFLTLLLGFWG